MPRVAPFCFNQRHFFFFQCCVNLIVSIYLKYWVDPEKHLKLKDVELRCSWQNTWFVIGLVLVVTKYLDVLPVDVIGISLVLIVAKYLVHLYLASESWLDSYSYSWQSNWCIRVLPVDVIGFLLVFVTKYLAHLYRRDWNLTRIRHDRIPGPPGLLLVFVTKYRAFVPCPGIVIENRNWALTRTLFRPSCLILQISGTL